VSGHSIPQPQFPDDDGTADPRVAEALAGFAERRLGAYSVLAALAGSRLLIPVVAVLTEEEETVDGLRLEKESDMALPTLVGADGRRGVLGFTSLESLARWRPDARPVAVRFREACAAALDEGAAAVVVDVAGPECYPIDGGLLRLLADGGMIAPPHETPAVLAAVWAAGEAAPGVAMVRAEFGERAELAVRFLPGEGADEDAALKALTAELSTRLPGLITGALEIGVVPEPER
jgi:SseB protein N-terminal domain